jgi:hypothetical protein
MKNLEYFADYRLQTTDYRLLGMMDGGCLVGLSLFLEHEGADDGFECR